MLQERTTLTIHYHILKFKGKYVAQQHISGNEVRKKVKLKLCNYKVILVSSLINPISTPKVVLTEKILPENLCAPPFNHCLSFRIA